MLIIFYLIINRLTKGNGQNQANELCVLRYNVLVPFLSFLCFDSCFSFVFLLCLYYNTFVKPRFSSFYYFKHVRLLDFSFCFNVFLLSRLGF